MSVHNRTLIRGTDTAPTLLDIAAEVLVADPTASLAEVAFAAGIGRTTLHKHYATRDDLVRAVGRRAVEVFERAIAGVPETDADGGLAAIVAALIPIGPQLAFLWRNPVFDHLEDVGGRWSAAEQRGLAVLERARARGLVGRQVPPWWLLQTLYSLIYVAAESVHSGHLAPRDAPTLVLDTFLRGLGPHPLEARHE